MATGFSFVDNSEISVREKIDRYFQRKNTAIPEMPVLDESTSDESVVNSFCGLDESFAQILSNNPHVTLIRNSKKQTSPQSKQQTEHQGKNEESSEESTEEQPQVEHRRKSKKSSYMPTPTRRGEVRRPIKSDESIKLSPYDLWYVSDESFLEMEKLCESPRDNENATETENDTTLLYDVQAPSFLIHNSDSDSDDLLDDSVFERRSHSMLSPMKQVALRRPSTILEESTIRSINSSGERSGSSLSLKQSLHVAEESNPSVKSHSYRPSLLNVFPTRSRIGFYDNLESPSSSTDPPTGKENSITLMRFDSLDEESPLVQPVTESKRNNSFSLMQFDNSVDEVSSSNLSVDEAQHNSSMSDSEQPDQFNDTLEAVDYYMKQGKKILDKTSASTTLLQSFVTASPKNRNNSLLKQTLARRHLMSMNGDNIASKKLF